jgi:hypothetical protein
MQTACGLTRRFGAVESLGTELKFPVFVESLAPARYEERRTLRKSMPAGVASFITEFRKGVTDGIRHSADNVAAEGQSGHTINGFVDACHRNAHTVTAHADDTSPWRIRPKRSPG